MTRWDDPDADPLADLLSTREQLDTALYDLAAYERLHRIDPLAVRLLAWLERHEARRAERIRRQPFVRPDPLPIDGREYHRRQRRR